MDEVKDQLVKDVAGLKQRVAELGTQLERQVTETRVGEIVNGILEAAKPPKKRPFELSSRVKRTSAQTKPREGENAVKS